MSAVPFKAAGGLDVAGGDLKLSNIGTGTPAGGGRILSLATDGTAHYRTFGNLKANIDGGRLDQITAGNGMTVSALPGGGVGDDSQTVTLGTPDTCTVSSTDAVTAGSHTHAIGHSNDVSGASMATLLSANTTGGVKLESAHVATTLKFTDHASAPTVKTNKLYANSTSLYWGTTDLQVGSDANNQALMQSHAIVMAIALG